MNDFLMTGAELQCLREACGLDRDQLGERCGVQGRSIKYWETGSSNHGVPADVAAMVLEIDAQISKEAALQIQHYTGRDDDTVLVRTADPVKNEVASRVYLALRRRGQSVRIVAFDYQAYKALIEATGAKDSPANRAEWARQAVKSQAKPHRADQPA